MQRNTRTIAAAGLMREPRKLRGVCRGRVFLDNIKGVRPDAGYRVFEGLLEVDGSIVINGHSWTDVFHRILWRPYEMWLKAEDSSIP